MIAQYTSNFNEELINKINNCNLAYEEKIVIGTALINSYNHDIENLHCYKLECPYCKCKGGFVKHAYYTRTIYILDIAYRIRILRVKCTNPNCGRTHAILPVFITPYERISAMEIIAIAKMYKDAKVNSYDRDIIRFVKTYKKFEKLLSHTITTLGDDFYKVIAFCSREYKKCYMQSRRPRVRKNSELIDVWYFAETPSTQPCTGPRLSII